MAGGGSGLCRRSVRGALCRSEDLRGLRGDAVAAEVLVAHFTQRLLPLRDERAL